MPIPRQQPMLAGKYTPTKQRFPAFMQPKFDGIRALIYDGRAVSRTMKPLPNQFMQRWVQKHIAWLDTLDGEMIVGNPTSPDVYQQTMSAIMSAGGEPDFRFYVFDMHSMGVPFELRLLKIREHIKSFSQHSATPDYPELAKRCVFVETPMVYNFEQLNQVEVQYLEQGYEGAIIRSPSGHYKYGRSTPLGGELLKLKRFVDNEATIIGFEELLSNQNEAVISETGHQKRSSHQANKIPMYTLGALVVRNERNQTFNVGSGFTMAQRQEIWNNRGAYLGKTITYKEQAYSGYELPRMPIFKGFRIDGV